MGLTWLYVVSKFNSWILFLSVVVFCANSHIPYLSFFQLWFYRCSTCIHCFKYIINILRIVILRFIVFSFPKKSSGTVATATIAISCFLCIPGESVPAFCFVLSLCISVKVMVIAEKCLVSRILGETEMENAKAIFLMFFLRLTFCILHSDTV